MKLVEILAKELSEWPNGEVYFVQDPARDHDIWSCPNKPVWEGTEWGALNKERQFTPQICGVGLSDDYKTAIITRKMWQAERDRQKGGEWKRHRGGKCPVPDQTQVEVKFRDGDIRQSHASDFFGWKHGEIDDARAEVMQYRVIGQPQEEEVEKEVFVDTLSTHKEFTVTGQWQQSSGPLAWRDTIIHCQAIIEDCEREIQKNVDLLDSEGLMIQTNTKTAMQHYESDVDMSDWRNWKAGDVVEVILDNYSYLPIGERYVVKEIEDPDYEFGMPVCVLTGSDPFNYQWPGDSEGEDRLVLKFIRRP